MSSTASALCKDWQTVVVTDANGCFGLDSVLIPSPPEINISSSLSMSCNGFNDGMVTAIPSGGTPGYSYLWQQTGEITETISGLAAGTLQRSGDGCKWLPGTAGSRYHRTGSTHYLSQYETETQDVLFRRRRWRVGRNLQLQR